MEEQLVQAVAIASNPTAVQDPSLPQQALDFLQHLKTITHESWTCGWQVYSARDPGTGSPKYPEQARLFGLNLVADYLESHVSQSSDPQGSIAYLQESALTYIHSEFINGNGERTASYIKNKLAQVMTTLLVQSYNLPQPSTLLSALLALVHTHPNSASPSSSAAAASFNPTPTDLVLRILHDLSITLGSDVTLRSARSKDRLQRDSVVRDEIRANHAMAIAQLLWQIIEQGLQKINSNTNDTATAAVVEMATSVVGDYVSWIDISLVVTPETLPIFFALLQHSSLSLRKVAADALFEVISKGMKPPGKLELLRVLDLTNVVGSLEAQTRTSGSEGQDHLVELREKLAKLANGVTLEIVKVLEDSSIDQDTRSAADEMLLAHLPLVLAFLADEYDEPTECVLSGINATLSQYKRVKKRLPIGHSLPQPQVQALTQLVDVALGKMKYDDEAEWTGAGTRADASGNGDDNGAASDEEEANFVELRKHLQQILASVASIEEIIFAVRVQSLIIDTLRAVEEGLNGRGAQVTWQQAEVAVFAAYFYVEVLINASGQTKQGVNANVFVQMPVKNTGADTPSGLPRSSNRHRLQMHLYPTLPLSQIGETVQSIVQSSISNFPHPAVQLQFFECLNRYATFFQTRPDNLPSAFYAWLDRRGLYNGHAGVRYRVWYLFSRFIRETGLVIPPDFVQRIVDGMREVLVVEAGEVPSASGEQQADVLVKATEAAGPFDSQLYLFESSGLLLNNLRSQPTEQVELLKTVCDPLVGQLQAAVQAFSVNQSDLRQVLQVHHLMLAMSNLAKGFPDATPASGAGGASEAQTSPSCLSVFKSVTEQILTALGQLNQFSIIREAARGAFSRIVATTGEAVLPFIPNLIQALLGQVTTVELVDFLSFLGLVVSKYKHRVQPILDELLLVLIERIFEFLNTPVTGTDDAVQRSELQRAYIAFLSTLVTAGVDGILTSQRNVGQLQTILQSIVYYANQGDDLACQRASFNVLGKLVVAWAGGESQDGKGNGNGTANGSTAPSTTVNGVSSSSPSHRQIPPPVTVPGFESFIYDTLVPLTFEVPAKTSFDFNDAQSQLVLTEMSSVLKTILSARGPLELPGFLMEVYFPKIGCPAELGAQFVDNLRTLETRKFKTYLQGFISQSRGG